MSTTTQVEGQPPLDSIAAVRVDDSAALSAQLARPRPAEAEHPVLRPIGDAPTGTLAAVTDSKQPMVDRLPQSSSPPEMPGGAPLTGRARHKGVLTQTDQVVDAGFISNDANDADPEAWSPTATWYTPKTPGGVPLAPGLGGWRMSIYSDISDPEVELNTGNPSLLWYVPDLMLAPDPDPLFAFDVRQETADGKGHPFNTATLTFTVCRTMDPFTKAGLDERFPDARVEEVFPIVVTEPMLVLGYADSDGSFQYAGVPGSATATADGWKLTFKLVGDQVILAFTELKTTGIFTPMVGTFLYNREEVAISDEEGTISYHPPQTTRHWAYHQLGVLIGTKFAASAYRSLYTVTSGGTTRAIVNTQDLERFDVVQSEYQELTALGDVASRYPSLRALYIGLVSGTVVAVPAAYGIQRTPLRCAASCDALVDSGSALSTGCRFHLTFNITPVVDPGDLVRLSTDLQTAPTLPRGDLKIVLPSDLDRRTAPTFASPFVNAATFAVGTEPHTFILAADIVDDAMPAVVKVNAFLKELSAAGPPPLIGQLAIRLDDAHTTPVMTSLILDLHTTGGDQELVIDTTQPQLISIHNVAPYDLQLTNYTSHTVEGFLTTPLDQILTGGATTTITVPDGEQVLTVHRGLSLPDPMPPALLPHYVTFRTTDVQRIHHLLGVNATAVLGASADRTITALSVTITLHDAPEVLVPTLALDPTRPVDRATVDIPVQSALTGLDAAVTIAARLGAGAEPRQISLTHDFLSSPILVLTPTQLAAS
jgi:hypothetical protein